MKVDANRHATVSYVYSVNTKMTYLLQTAETPQTDGMVDFPEVNNTNDNNTTDKTFQR